MAMSYEEYLHLAKPAQDNQAWKSSEDACKDTIGQALCPAHVYWVSPAFTAENLGNAEAADRRHFDTIQAAINAAFARFGYTNEQITIFIYPGTYNEKLTLTGRLGLFGLNAGGTWAGSGGRMPMIRGDGTPTPVLVWQPRDGEVGYLNASGLLFENGYVAANAVPIQEPYMLDSITPSSYGGSRNVLSFHGCIFRMQTWGEHNLWTRGFRIRANNVIRLTGETTVAGMSYAGGHNDGGIGRLFDMYGDSAAGKYAWLYARGCYFKQYLAGILGGNHVVMEDGVEGQIVRCTTPNALSGLIDDNGGGAPNYMSGWNNESEAQANDNVFGVDATYC